MKVVHISKRIKIKIRKISRFTYLVEAFTPHSRVFPVYEGGDHYGGNKPVSIRWKPSTIRKLLVNVADANAKMTNWCIYVVGLQHAKFAQETGNISGRYPRFATTNDSTQLHEAWKNTKTHICAEFTFRHYRFQELASNILWAPGGSMLRIIFPFPP